MFNQHIERVLLACFAFIVLIVAGCNGSGGGFGTLNLAITDTPVDGATNVVVTFTGVEVQPAGEEDASDEMDSMDMGGMDDNDMDDDGSAGGSQRLEFNFASPRQIDLLQQQGGNSASLLSGVTLPAGNYAWIRLKVDASQSSITLTDGTVHPLVIPSGDETGLKLVHGFTVADGGVVNFTIDFDLRQSITLANGKYILKPVLRITDNVVVGGIHGVVSNTLTIGSLALSDPACMPAAYLYSGADVTPVDIDAGAAVQPVTTATLSLDTESGDYVYTAGFLATGSYTVALTCAATDNPAAADALVFTAAKNATVTAGTTTEVDFP
jgi:hypothetical protein